MSRHGYGDGDSYYPGLWEGIVGSAMRGKRGQAFFRALIGALDAMPEKRLIAGAARKDGDFCALGALGHARGLPMDDIEFHMDANDWDALGRLFDIAAPLAQEVMYNNDEQHDGWDSTTRRWREMTPEVRWQWMRDWAAMHIRVTPDELLPLEPHAQT